MKKVSFSTEATGLDCLGTILILVQNYDLTLCMKN